MYCPKCFDNSLELSEKGVIYIAVNGMHRDTGRLLYNLGREDHNEIKNNILGKIEEFFKWYSDFQNKEPIDNVQVYTSSFTCQNKCVLPASTQIGIVGTFVEKNWLIGGIRELAEKYRLPIANPNFLSEQF